MQAADRFHVPPWELLARGRAWTEIAITALSAERRAAKEVHDREERRARMQRMLSGKGRR